MPPPHTSAPSSSTWYAVISHFQELFISARVAEEGGVYPNRTLSISCAGAVQEEVYIYVTVAREGYPAEVCHEGVIASVASCLKDEGLLICTGRLKHGVVARVFLDKTSCASYYNITERGSLINIYSIRVVMSCPSKKIQLSS